VLVCPNDWEEPNPARPYESSAAAIAAGGMWQLAGLVHDRAAAGYADYALRILTRLCEDDFLSHRDAEWEGLLKHGSYHESKGLGVDESVMWGDYWFLDALAEVDRWIAGSTPGTPRRTSP
jgi:unsaturated chondroitin disaccharide hydrolase